MSCVWKSTCLAAVVSLCACREKPKEVVPADVPAPEKAGEAAVPFDLGKVMRQVHFAFRPQGKGFEGAQLPAARTLL